MSQTAHQDPPETDEKILNTVLLSTEIKSWWIHWVIGFLERFCISRRISPNVLTLVGLGLSFLCFLLFATGHILTGGWMVMLTGSFDFLDGRVARATNQVTRQGGFLDSVIDRYQDFFLFAGLCIFFRESWVFYVALAALAGATLISYVRARAEILGIDLSRVGSFQRPERLFLIGFGGLVSSVFQVALMPFYGLGNPPPQHVLILVLLVLAVGTNWTAIHRIRYTMRMLEGKGPE